MKNSSKKGKSRMVVKIIAAAVLALALISLVVGIIRFEMLKKERDEAMKQGIEITLSDQSIGKIDLVGLLDSYGVPYSESVGQSFFDLIRNELERQNLLGSELDLFNLYINKTWHMDGIFENKVTINEMIQMKNFSLDFVRAKYSEKIKQSLCYTLDSQNGERTIYEYVEQLNNPVVVYSCSANDLFFYFGTSLESLTIKKAAEVICNVGPGLDFLEGNIQKNINTILSCNPKSQVFVMGLYLPADNFFVNRAGSLFIRKINNRIQEVCNRFENVYYVDVSSVCFEILEGDFHPNQNGQTIMAHELAKAMSANIKPVREYPYDSIMKEKMVNPRIDVNVVVEKFREYSYSMRDYVEYSTAFEWSLHETGFKDASWESLLLCEDIIIEMLGDSIDSEQFRKGYEICIIEHKILEGIIEAEQSLHPEGKKNDKIGLMPYLKK